MRPLLGYGERLWTPLALCLLLAAIVAAASFGSAGTQRIVTDALIKLVVVVGTYIFVGNSGVLSFGHIGFMGIGAYVAAWLTIPPETKSFLLPKLPGLLAATEWPASLAAVAAGAAAALFAFIVGLPLMRLSGISASIGTFAVLAVVNAVLSNWTSMTGGQGSLYGLPSYTNLPVATAWAMLAIVIAWIYQRTAYGFRLRSTREDETAAKAAGVDVHRERLIAFVLSAFFVGVSGALYAHFLGVVIAKEFYLKLTFMSIAMLVIGGLTSLSGAVLGVVVVSSLGELLREVERGANLGFLTIPARPGLQEVVLAAALLLILIFRPRGLTAGRELPPPRRWMARRLYRHRDPVPAHPSKADIHGSSA